MVSRISAANNQGGLNMTANIVLTLALTAVILLTTPTRGSAATDRADEI